MQGELHAINLVLHNVLFQWSTIRKLHCTSVFSSILWYVRVHLAVAISLITSGSNGLELKNLYCLEAHQMPERMKNKKCFSWSQSWGVMKLVSFSIHFLWRSRLTTVL